MGNWELGIGNGELGIKPDSVDYFSAFSPAPFPAPAPSFISQL